MIYGDYGRVLAMVLAGGKGTRLYPLTRYRTKPAVFFAAKYRIVDFALSNLVNSGFFSIYVLVQFKSQSLNEHILRGWQLGGALRDRDIFITTVPPQMWTGEHWYKGTADAIYQNIHLITTFDADRIIILAADHVYKIDIRQFLEFHLKKGADITICATVVPKEEAKSFGVIQVDEKNRVIGFFEKVPDPPEIPNKEGFCLASMGNYIFEREVIEELLLEDAHDPSSSHDFGKDIFPKAYKKYKVFAYDFTTNKLPGNDRPYWRDVGTIQSYWTAHMDILNPNPDLNLYNSQWPIRTVSYGDPPAYIYPADGYKPLVLETLQAEGSRILGATVIRSVLGRNCIINPGAIVEECIIGKMAIIGEKCKLKRVIVDSNVYIPPGTVIGYDPEADSKRFYLDESGIVVVPMPSIFLRSERKYYSYGWEEVAI